MFYLVTLTLQALYELFNRNTNGLIFLYSFSLKVTATTRKLKNKSHRGEGVL